MASFTVATGSCDFERVDGASLSAEEMETSRFFTGGIRIFFSEKTSTWMISGWLEFRYMFFERMIRFEVRWRSGTTSTYV